MTSKTYYNSPKQDGQDPKDRPNFGTMRRPLGRNPKGQILSGKDFLNKKKRNQTQLEIERRNKFGTNI